MLLAILSVVQIGLFLAIAAAGCTGMFSAGERSSVVPFLPLVFLGGWLACDQYRAVFRANRQAAANIKRLHESVLFVGGLFFLLLVVRAFFAIDPLLHTLLMSFVALAYFAFVTHQFHLWHEKLQFTPAVERDEAAGRFTLKEVLLAITAVSCVFAASSYFMPRDRPRMEEHVSPQDCPFVLPAAAKDVSSCYAPGGDGLAYEFEIDADGAVEWADSLGLSTTLPLKSPFPISRYGSMHPRVRSNRAKEITKGWAASGLVAGQPVIIAFDHCAQRAYYTTVAP